MTAASFTLLCVALLMAAESVWAIVRPASFRERVRELLASSETSASVLMASYWIAALALWAVAAWGQSWTHKALFFMGVTLAIAGFVCTRPAWISAWYNLCLGNRSPHAIRALYLLEGFLAVGLVWLALAGH